MVRSESFHFEELQSRFLPIRPGIAVSALLHVALLLGLATALSFAPKPQPAPEPPPDMTTIFEHPPAPPPKAIQPTPIFKPMEMKPIEGVTIKVPPLILPPVPPQKEPSHTTTVTTTAPPAPSEPVIRDPQPISREGLVFPDRAIEANRSGYVDFAFVILPDGSVGDPQVIAENPAGYGFAAAARKAFPRWRFHPKLVDGHPVAAPATIRISFQLR